MSTIRFTVLGQPTGKGRPRVTRRGITYTPEKTVQAEQSFLAQALPYKPDKPLEGPLLLHIFAVFARPKRHYRTGKNSHLLRDDAPRYHTSKPDASNTQKLIEDALNGVFYLDDSQIADSRLIKVYGLAPRIDIALATLSPG